MDPNGCCPLSFVDILNNALYFEVAQTDVDVDSFRSDKHSSSFIRCSDQKFLILNDAGELQIQDLMTRDHTQIFPPESMFNIDIYKDSALTPRLGRAVMLYANRKGHKKVVCCRGNKEVCAEAMEPPRDIAGTKHKALFYMIEVSSHNYMFESSEHPKRFLGIECDETNSNLYKLVLREKDDDVVDSNCHFLVPDYNK